MLASSKSKNPISSDVSRNLDIKMSLFGTQALKILTATILERETLNINLEKTFDLCVIS